MGYLDLALAYVVAVVFLWLWAWGVFDKKEKTIKARPWYAWHSESKPKTIKYLDGEDDVDSFGYARAMKNQKVEELVKEGCVITWQSKNKNETHLKTPNGKYEITVSACMDTDYGDKQYVSYRPKGKPTQH